MNRRFDLNVRGLGLLLTPTFLRKPILMGILYSLLAPLTHIMSKLRSFRMVCDYRLNHNGQVCYLRAVLNDQFDPVDRRITISDEPFQNEHVVIHHRAANTDDPVPIRRGKEEATEAFIGRTITRRGFGGTNAYDFCVNLPFDLYQSIDIGRLRAVVNSYKLASKRFGINYI